MYSDGLWEFSVRCGNSMRLVLFNTRWKIRWTLVAAVAAHTHMQCALFVLFAMQYSIVCAFQVSSFSLWILIAATDLCVCMCVYQENWIFNTSSWLHLCLVDKQLATNRIEVIHGNVNTIIWFSSNNVIKMCACVARVHVLPYITLHH